LEPWFEKVQKIAEQVAVGAGCELYDIEITGTGKGRVLQVFIDKPEGILIEDCSTVSKGLNEFLDADENIIPGEAYSLEVSSPGLERRLKTEKHFTKVIDKKIAVQLSQNLGSLGVKEPSLHTMKKFENTLIGVEANHILFKLKEETVRVPLNVVEKAKLVFEMNMNKPSGKPGGHKQKR
jgi:ribosome maturation factor RimP